MLEEHIYHIYPLGYLGANMQSNNGEQKESLAHIIDLIPHLQSLSVTLLLLGPVFESSTHGYDTIDYRMVDRRIGTNQDLTKLVKACHEAGIKVMLDCVFNHISREHEVFLDLKKHKTGSRYKDFISGVNFNQNNMSNDGFSYDNWAGHDNLVKWNLDNENVRNYLLDTAEFWVKTFDIDGLRMDAADVMSKTFLRILSQKMYGLKQGFLMLGEVVHGNYNDWLSEGNLGAITNYEVYKGLYSSLNDRNYYEIAYALNRQFGSEGIYNKETMVNFTDNHDVNRVASRLKEERHLYPLYIMMYTMPGVPALYYGSEYGMKGEKVVGTDAPLRPTWEQVMKTKVEPLLESVKKFATIRKAYKALKYGGYKQVYLDHALIGYERFVHDQRIVVFINSDETNTEVPVPTLHGTFKDVLNDEVIHCSGRVAVYGNWGRVLVPMT